MRMTIAHCCAAQGKLWGRGLRHFLLSTLANAGRPLSVAELSGIIDERAARLSGRPSKVISDALRWEIKRGHVRKVRRGVYSFARMPASTRRWVERRARQLRQLLAAHAAGIRVTIDWSVSQRTFFIVSSP